MDYYEIPTWHDFQHYKDRNPPWIKLHYELFQSLTWVAMDDASRVLAIACMLIASRHDGKVPCDSAYVQRIAHLNKKPNFKPLIDNGFLVHASTNLADASKLHTNARPETETETYTEEETETKNTTRKRATPSLNMTSFEEFWNAYPLKKGRGKAEESYGKVNPTPELHKAILDAIAEQRQGADWLKDNGQYIPMPATWLNQKRWMDKPRANLDRYGHEIKQEKDEIGF